MLKNFKSGYAVSGSSEIASTEKNDCVVRAIANACDVNYDQAHKYVADTFDRKKGKGTMQMMSTLDNVKEMTFDEVGQLDLFNKGITRKLKMLGHGPKQGGDMINPKYKHKPVAYTVKAFAQKFNKGKYIVGVNKHALAICDGVVVDNGNYQYDGYRRPVECAYQVS
jgi:hypothetical protein|tara:strand:+ start:880 stop:1380 length:501 start_codon:yes stop_codon:yes gene_type:complete